MIHSILLVIPKPDSENPEISQKWGAALDNILGIVQKSKEIQPLAENVLLLPLDKTLDAFGQIIGKLKAVDYKYLILEEEEIVWHEVSKKV